MAASAGDSGVTPPSSPNRPANRPLSQVRCSGVNGAFSGRKDGIGGRGVMLMPPPPATIGFERVDLMAAREGEEAFLARGAVREIGLEDALDGLRRVLRLHVAIELAAERGIGPEAAADQDVIALDRVALLARPAPCRRAGRSRT